MKAKYITITLLIHLSALATYAQEPNISFVLSQSETGTTRQYLASDRVTLKPGFVYNSITGKTFNAKIDKTLPLPENSSTYITSSGIVTTNPEEGAVVGAVPGSAAVTSTGAATYQIPIEVPTGINGMQPQVAIMYNSQGGFGNLGTGWDIAGASAITRGGKNIYFDGSNNSNIPIKFDNTDALYLDGQRLIQLNNGTYSHFAAGAEYGTEIETHVRVKIIANPTGGIYFELTTKDGKTMEYGKTPDALVKNSNNSADPNVFAWKLSKVKDVYNNYMTYTYTEYGQYLQRIDYTGNTVAPCKAVIFSYNETLTVPRKTFISSFRLQQNKVLSGICTYSGATKINDYRFGYVTSGVDKHLDNVTQYARDNSKLKATKINWGSESTITTQNVGAFGDVNLTANKGLIYAGDVDGDGYADRIELWPGCDRNMGNGDGDKGHVIVHLFNKTSGNYNTSADACFLFSYIDNVNIPQSGLIKTKLVVSDINNDGKSEIAVTNVNYLYCYSYSNNLLTMIGNRKSLSLNLSQYSYLEVGTNRFNQSFSTDINNDQFGDIVYTYNYDRYNYLGQLVGKVTGYRYFTGNSSGLDDGQDQIVQNRYYDTFQIGDYNADGKADIFGIPSNSNFYDIINSNVSEYADGKWNSAANTRRQYAGDFNGDGLSDLLVQKNDFTWFTLLNNGFQQPPTQQAIPQFHNASDATGNGEMDEAILVDYNGDGLIDVLIGDETFSGNDFVKTTWRFYKNNSGSFSLELQFDTANRMAYYLADVNGDGVADIIISKNENNQNSFIAYTKLNAARRNLVTAITNGMNQTESFTYKNFSNYETYTSGEATAKVRPLRAPLLVTDTQTGPDGSITNYTFETPKYHTEGKGFLGFSTATSSNQSRDIKAVTQYEIKEIDQKYFYVGQASQAVTNYAGNEAISSASQTNTIKEIDEARKRYIPTVTAQTGTDFLKNLTQSTSTIYDNYGNVTTQTTIAGDDNDKITTVVETDYKTRTGGTVEYLPETVITTQKKSGEDDVVRTATYDYNDNGKLTKETKDPADVNKLVTEYKDFDQWGHACTVEVSITGKPVRKSTVVYTPSGCFVESKTNNLLETTSYVWDETLGLLKSETDYWNRATTYAYDAWNKPLMVTYPEGYRKGSALQWAAGAVPGAVYYSYDETKGSSPVWTWYNALGQEVRKDYYGLNEKKICVTTEYNAKKQLYRVSDPYFENESAYKTWAATYTYDSYGRPLTVTTKSDVSTMTYDTRTESVSRTVIGESTPYFTSSKLLNSAGQLKTSTENGKAVSFSYYPTGLTKTSTPEDGQALSMEYNLQGKRKYLKDPDAGEVFSIYNGFGELAEEKQKVHSSQYIVTTNNYNDNGTLNTIVRNGETTQYSYDDTDHKSRPSSRSIANKNTQYFGYDYYGRLESVSETIGDRTYDTYYGYDMYGRETSKQYPSYYLVSNTYDKYGNLTEVKDYNNRSIWKAVAENARGQITQERKGNNDTYYGFDDRGLPTYFSGNAVSMSYYFDNKGNLQYRSDNNGNEESFVYDTHDRLTNWNVTAEWGNYSKSNSIEYNPTTGNINSKTDIGTFKYNVVNNEPGAINPNPGPHALTSVDGALTALQAQTLNVTYTDFKKIKTLTEGNKYYELTYGVDDQRRKSEYKVNGQTQLTRYYLGDYEEEVDALGNIKQIHYLSGAIMITTITPSWEYEEHLYYSYTDYQGSLIALTDESGNIVERYAYDPWGTRRNPDNWTESDSRTSWIVNRGYTGHEHLDAFGIINMNGRVYDPLTAMFFSPDPYVQAPGSWLNYNRYGYCYGNPLKYTDPSGEIIFSILAAIFCPPLLPFAIAADIGGMINAAAHGANAISNFGDFAAAYGIGALGGAAAAVTGGATLAAMGTVTGGAALFGAGAIVGGVGYTAGTAVTSVGNAIYFHDPLPTPEQFGTGLAISAVTGGIFNVLANPPVVRDPSTIPERIEIPKVGIKTEDLNVNKVNGPTVNNTGISATNETLPMQGKVMNVVKGPDGQVTYKFDWPSNNGAIGGENMRTLQPKTVVTRYGPPDGKFASPNGTPFSDRALPSSYSTRPLNSYEVARPISVHESLARPCFNQPGMGTQWRFNNSIQYYLDKGYLLPRP